MRRRAAVLCMGMVLGLGGCRHRTVVPAVPPPNAPVEPVSAPSEQKAPVIEAPQVKLPPIPIAAAAAKPKKERKRPAKTAANSAVPEPAPAPPPAAPAAKRAETNPIGALTAGTTSDPQTRQDAADLIAAIEKRLNSLPAQMDDAQKAQISKVRNFWRDAQEALKSGDAEGAMTLATKAKLLLDDQEQ